MNFVYEFHPDAQAEYNESSEFYFAAEKDVDLAFIDEVEKAIDFITRFPNSLPFSFGKIRRKVLDQFPFTGLYAFDGDLVRIIAVAHHKRRPFYWIDRLQ